MEEIGSRSLIMSDVRRRGRRSGSRDRAGALTTGEARARSAPSSPTSAPALGEVGVALGSDVTAEVLVAAQRYRAMKATGNWPS
jgi:phosphate transport system permease protein